MSHSIIVDQNTCIGCGVCAALCSAVYTMSSEDGKSHIVEGKENMETLDPDFAPAKEAEGACPVNAITIEK